MKAAVLFFTLLMAILSSLAAQDGGKGDEDDDFWDEWPVMEGDGLTIVGSMETTQQIEVINRETIEKLNAADIPSLMQEAIGLTVTRYGSYGNMANISLRGFDSKRIAILVDGIPVNSTSSGSFDFFSIDPLSIDRIEVIYGGSDTKYNVSGAMGGVINIVTVRKPNPGWTFSGTFSNLSYMPENHRDWNGQAADPQWQDIVDSQYINLSASYGAGPFAFNLSIFGNRAGNHYSFRDDLNISRRKESNEIYDTGAAVSFLWNFDNNSTLIASGNFYFGDKQIPVSGYASVYGKQRDFAIRENLALDMPRAFHDDFSAEFFLGHSWKMLTFDLNSSRHDEHNISFINRWGWHPGEKFTLRFGGDYRFINIDSTNTGNNFGNRGGFYLTPEYSPVKNLLLIASIKGVTDGSKIVPIPKLGLAWRISENITLTNNYFRSFKFPDFDDLYWAQARFQGNPNLKNEDSWGADAGMEYYHKGLFDINSVIYGQWIIDSIHWANIAGTWNPRNSGNAAFAGWDTKANVNLPLSFWVIKKPVLSLFYIMQMSWLLSDERTFKDNLRIPYMPVHTFGASLEIPWITVKNKFPGVLIISGRYESLRYVNSLNTMEMEPVFLLNVIFNQKVHKNFGIFWKINNLLNKNYDSYEFYPMPGISLTLGLRAEFEAKKGGH